MTPELWKQVESVFEVAAELSPAERKVFLETRCGGNENLRFEVVKLLKSADEAAEFMESPVWTDGLLDSSVKNVLSTSLDQRAEEQGDMAGTIVGPYRLVSEIGRGGMGAVYRGERIDGEFHQEVAIKLLKRGLDSDFVIKRFRHERQILASFEHPFISRLLDGGTLQNGIPYFVMEYIAGGVNIYDWCDERKLDISARIRLFLKVCSALEYAHERKIVHRDIKPGNILINRSGAPKLLDFGIAKILDPDLIHESFHPTASLVRLMTPDYASPEQVRGFEITPASDIYSMGVLLYELLSGHRPYRLVDRGMHELSALICEVDSVAPSQALLDSCTLMNRYVSAEAVSEARGIGFARLGEVMPVLDPIILRALAKAPENRYLDIREFVSALSEFSKPEALTGVQGPTDPKSLVASISSPSRSMAVLPFRTIMFTPESDTTDEQFLGVGLADSLTSRLGRISRFLVIPTSSILGLGSMASDPIRAGRQLKVDFILDGSIKVASDRLRLSVQLLDVNSNAAVWAASIDEKAGDLFALEEALSNQLIAALIPRISSAEMAGFSRRGTYSPEAFENYLRGRYHFNTMNEDHLAKAFVLFHQAIADDPNYAHAYCGIANYYNWLGVIGVLPPSECYPPAIDAARKAVDIDPELSEAHASLGFALHVGLFDWKAAENHFQRAIDLNANNATAFLWYSTFLLMSGRFEKGFEYADRAASLDPLTPYSHYNIGSGLYYARRFDEAEAQHQKVVDEFPEYGLGYYGLSKLHRHLGKTTLAIEENVRAMELLSGSTLTQISAAECLAADGQIQAAQRKLDEIRELSKRRFVSPYMVALVYSYFNEHERTLELLEESVALGEPWLACAPVEARFETLFGTDRFQAIVKAVNHPLTRRSDPIPGAETALGFNELTTVLIDNPTD